MDAASNVPLTFTIYEGSGFGGTQVASFDQSVAGNLSGTLVDFNVDPFANPRQIVDWMGGYFGMPARLLKERIDMLMEKFDLVPHQTQPSLGHLANLRQWGTHAATVARSVVSGSGSRT